MLCAVCCQYCMQDICQVISVGTRDSMISLMYSEYHDDHYSKCEKIQTRSERPIIKYSKQMRKTRRKKDIR